jgi:UDP-glucose 4-epimerase
MPLFRPAIRAAELSWPVGPSGKRCVLITGATGFIGSHLLTRCLNLGWRVRVVSRRASHVDLDPNVDWVHADISSAQMDWDAVVDGVDAIFHLAWSTVPYSADQDPGLNLAQNVPPGVRLAAAAARRGSVRLVFISSGGTVYGVPQWVPIDEGHPTLPMSFYGEAKMTMERHLDLFRTLKNLDRTVLRVSNPYGPGQRQGRNFGAITTFALRALMDEEIVIWGDGSTTRDYLYIDDVIDAVILAASRATPASTYNIGSGEGRSLGQIIDQLQSLIGRAIRVRYEPARPYDVPTNVLNIQGAAHELGWTPKTSFAVGLERTINALRADLAAGEDLPAA